MHLKNFTMPERPGWVWVYEMPSLVVRPSAIENVAVERDRYNVTGQDGTSIRTIDEALEKIESNAAPVIDKMAAGETKLTAQERADFVVFLAFMHLRTDASRRMMAEIMVGLRQAAMAFTAEDDNAFAAFRKFGERAGVKWSEEEWALVREMAKTPSSHFDFEVDKQATLQIFETWNVVADAFCDMSWTLLKASGGRYFITSDDPVVVTHPHDRRYALRGRGLRSPDAEVSFPLSKEVCWIGHWTDYAPEKMIADSDGVKTYNRLRAIYAERQFYAHENSAGLQALARKYKNPAPRIAISGPGTNAGLASIRFLRGKGRHST